MLVSDEYGPEIVTQVNIAMEATNKFRRPDHFIDPTALGSLIVSIASLAWQVYDSRQKRGKKPAHQVLAREVRRIEYERTNPDHSIDKIIDIVVAEIIEAAEDDRQWDAPTK